MESKAVFFFVPHVASQHSPPEIRLNLDLVLVDNSLPSKQ